MRGVLWTAEPLQRTVKFLPGIDHVLARRDFDSPPAAWELLMVARGGAPPFAGYLDWGFSELTCEVGSSHERDVVLQRIGDLVAALHVPNRVVEMVGELAYELVMNAMYDAPVDARGRAIYAANRKAQITLAAHERPTVRAGTDGSRFVLQVSDPFGRLERRHIVDGLARGFAGGEQDRSHGGAGLGLFMCHNACSALCFDITRGTRTEVTAVLDLDLNLRELRTLAKSLHVWSAG